MLDSLLSSTLEQICKQTGASVYQAEVGLVVTGILGVAAIWKLIGGTRYNLPPGPRPLPIIGNLLGLGGDKRLYLCFHNMGVNYGDLATFYVGPYRCVIISNAELLRESFIRDDMAYADRYPFSHLDLLTNDGKDIFAAPYSPRLQQQRKMAHAALRKYASGEALEHHVQFAFEAMCKAIDKSGKFVPFDMGYLVAYNIRASMCFGTKFEFDDPFLTEIMSIQIKLGEAFNSLWAVLCIAPIMKHIPNRIRTIVKDISSAFDGFLNKCLSDHLESYNPDKLTDFTYHMIHAWKEGENEGSKDAVKTNLLDRENYKYTLFDMFFAGTDTSRATLAWIWQYLAAFPEVQDKAQKEIDDVIGDGPVTIDCHESLPYVDAVLHEVMRIRPVSPSGVPRRVRQDTKLSGYDIPAGTMMMQNTWGIHHDPRNWKDPDSFLPERWLDESGQYVFQQNGFVPFGIGRRSCIGESFAKLELHMLTTLLLQRYTLKPAPGRRIDLNIAESAAVRAKTQDIYVEKRVK